MNEEQPTLKQLIENFESLSLTKYEMILMLANYQNKLNQIHNLIFLSQDI
jgi:hypothetical protein